MIFLENLKAFTMNIKTEEDKEYWTFENYLNDTHSDHNKSTLKQVNVIYRHYLDGLQRPQQAGVPKEIKKCI